MPEKDKSYRFRLTTELFTLATKKANRADLTLAQVLRRLLRAWVADKINLPEPTEGDGGDSEKE